MFKMTALVLVTIAALGCLPEDSGEVESTDTVEETLENKVEPPTNPHLEPWQVYCRKNPRKCPKPRI